MLRNEYAKDSEDSSMAKAFGRHLTMTGNGKKKRIMREKQRGKEGK